MSDNGPPLVRPVPRRPFDVNLTSPTPPSDASNSPSPNPDSGHAKFLSSKLNGYAPATPSESGSLSRNQSIMNLTSSTLMGIYAPSSSKKDRFDREELDTPWGTGAQTPVKRLQSMDDSTFELMQDRSSLLHRRRSSRIVPPQPTISMTSQILSLAPKIVLLFSLGMGYGTFVSHLKDGSEELTGISLDHVMRPGTGWTGLVIWGFSGVGLGALLPWVDGLWANMFGTDSGIDDSDDAEEDESETSSTDWALAARCVGVFLGIAYAIRRLPWASNLQISLTLALVNPFLWYLIDRSKPGFLLSAAVGMTGSAVLMGVYPDMMPPPSMFPPRNASVPYHDSTETLVLGNLASQHTLELAIWTLSVLFCSCVCFGNIGRRLALSRPSAHRGRWAGVQ